MQTIRILLTAGEELQEERMEIADLVENLNASLERRGMNILMMSWDSTSDMGDDGSAGLVGFNDYSSNSDLCLTLYCSTISTNTKEEIENAYQSLCSGKNPQKIYVYFKDADIQSPEMQEFRSTFTSKFGHFYCKFSNIDTLKADFLLQFMEYQSNHLGHDKLIEIRDSKVLVDGKPEVELKNVPFAGKNEEYTLLQKSIRKTEKLLSITEPEEDEYAEYALELKALKEKREKMENNLWETALLITRLSTHSSSERLERAMELFLSGEIKGAQAVLNEDEIEHDVKNNMRMVQMGEEGKKGLKINIEEYELKISTLKSEMAEGWLEKIIALQEKIIEICKVVNGEISEKTGAAYAKLSKILNVSGNYQRMLESAEKSLEIRKKVFGDRQHESIAESLLIIGGAYSRLGNYSKSLEYHLKALEIRKDLFGARHRNVAESYHCLGVVYHEMGEYTLALEYLRKSLDILKEQLGEQHLEIATCYSFLGAVYHSLGENTQSLEYLRKSLEIRKGHLNHRHPDVAISYNDLGVVYHDLGDDTQSMKYHLRSLDILKGLFGEHHPIVAVSYNNLGIVYRALGKYTQSLEYYLKSLDLYKELLGNRHPDVAMCCNNLGNVYQDLGDYSQALEYYLKSLELRKEVVGERHPDVAASYNDLGIVYHNLEEYSNALEYFFRSIELYKERFGVHHPNVAMCYNRIGVTYSCMNEYSKALEFFSHQLTIEIGLNRKADLALCYSNLAFVYSEIGDIPHAIEHYEKSANVYAELGDNEGKADVLRIIKELKSKNEKMV